MTNITVNQVIKAPAYEGTSNKNTHIVSLTVNGVTYEARIRERTGTVRLPLELQHHPLADVIRSEVVNAKRRYNEDWGT